MDRVLEIGGYGAGFCGRLFVQAGADVVRVDFGAGPPAWVSARALDLYLHPGKRRVQTHDLGVIAELAATADVVVAEAGTADELAALGFDEWAAPVKVGITPFGRTGPKCNWPATPATLLAMGGYSNVMGDEGRAPLTLPGHYVEFQAGAFGYAASNAALLDGPPNVIDIGMLEVVMALSQFTTVLWHCAGRIRARHGNDYWSIVPTNLFRCVDGWVYINIIPNFWDPFTVFLERPDLVLDARFKTNDRRMQNREALHAIVSEVVGGMTKGEVQARANEARIPCGLVLTLDEVLADPHLAARRFWQVVEDASGETFSSPRPAWHFRGEPQPALALAEAEREDG